MASAGTRTGKATGGTWTLEQPRTLKNRGGGHGVWIFENGTLTNLRTFKGGAFKKTIAFARTADGLNCSATEILLREDGVTGVNLTSAFDGRPSQIMNSKQISSTCRVMKQDQAPVP